MTASIPFQCTVSPGASGYGSRRSHGQGQSELEEGTIIVGRCVGVAGVIEPWKLASFLSLSVRRLCLGEWVVVRLRGRRAAGRSDVAMIV